MKLRKWLIILALALWAFSLLAGCGQEKTEKKGQEINSIRVAMSLDYPPFEFIAEKDGKYQGFDVDLIRAIGQEMGTTIKIVPYSFDEIIPDLADGKIDAAVSAISVTAERQKIIAFSEPYYSSRLTIVVREDETAIQSFPDLAGKRVAVQSGTTNLTELAKLKNVIAIERDTPLDCFKELKNGNVDAVVNDRPINDYFINQGIGGIKSLPDRLTVEDFAIAVEKKNPLLLKKINAALRRLQANGEYRKLFEKWFHSSQKKK